MISITVYSIMHVLSIMGLTACTFMAFAAPRPELRKRYMMVGGLLSLVALTGGFGLLARYQYGWPGWVLVKVACWLWLTVAAGIAFRKPDCHTRLGTVTALVVGIAVFMVYKRPF